MQDSKFFVLLRTLQREELSAFDKYLKKMHREEEASRSVFLYVKKFHPILRDEKKLDISYAFRKIFKDNIDSSEYNRKKLLNILSDLHLWLKEFLLWDELERDSFINQSLWLTILQKRGLASEFLKHASILQVELDAAQKRNVMDYMKGISLNYLLYNQYAQDKALPDIDTLNKCSNDLDLFYAVTRLKIACEMANLKNLLSWESNMEEMPLIKELSKKYLGRGHVLLTLYFEVYQLITSHQDESFVRIMKVLSENADKIEVDELHGILSYLYNYTAVKLRDGKEEYWVEIHLLNKFGLIHGAFTREGTMSTTQFSNIVNAASKVKDYDWAESFIEFQGIYLPEDVRVEIAIMSKAVILFGKEDFNKTLQILEGLTFKDIRHTIRSRSFILRSHYEINTSSDKILDYCVAFEAFLRRNRKPHREVVEATLNFIKFVRILVQRRLDKNQVSRLIESAKPIYFKAWLLEKLAKYKAEFATHKLSK